MSQVNPESGPCTRHTYLSARNRCRERVIADGDLLIHDAISKVVPTTRHGTDKNGDRMRLGDGPQVVRQTNGFRVRGEGYGARLSERYLSWTVESGWLTDFVCVWREMVRDWVLERN
jgi:hypothetical protein